MGDVEHQVAGVARLHDLTVDRGGQLQVADVFDLVGGDQRRSQGGKGVEGLAAKPLAVAELGLASGNVVHDRVAGNVVPGPVAGNPLAFPADHQGQFHFPVHLAAAARQDDGVPRATEGTGGLGE